MFNFHFTELKYRFYYIFLSFILIFLIIWYFKTNLLFCLINKSLIFTNLIEAFNELIYFSFLTSFIFNLPFFFFHYLSYSIIGWFEYELTNFLYKFLYIFFFIVIIFYFTLNYFLPNIIEFFCSFESAYLTLNLKIEYFLCFLNELLMCTILIICLFVFRFNLKNKRSLIFMCILMFISLITPPDFLSLLLISLPVLIIIELIYFIRLVLK